jgi:acyl-CoA thioesterase FadM
MILWFRFLLTILRGVLKGPIDPLVPYTTTFRSYAFWDSEFQYLNGARYFSFCELCVNEVNVRSGYFKVFLKYKVIGATTNKVAHFVKPVKNFKKFYITTHLLGWDKKFFYRKFQIHQDNQLKFEALYKIAIIGKNKKFSPEYSIEKMGFGHLKSPELPPEVSYLNFRVSKDQI